MTLHAFSHLGHRPDPLLVRGASSNSAWTNSARHLTRSSLRWGDRQTARWAGHDGCAFGKLTGGLAACLGIAGPGSTNLLTGLYDAKADRAPVLALSGQVPSKVLGRGAFQDVDLNAAFAAVARYSHTVLAGSDHAELVNIACKTALVERDVAHLVLPDEVQNLPAGTASAGGPLGRVADREVAPAANALRAAVESRTGTRCSWNTPRASARCAKS